MIGVLCPLLDFYPGYSVAGVVHTQLEILTRFEQDPLFITFGKLKGKCPCPHKSIPRWRHEEDWLEYAKRVQKQLDKALEGLSVVLVHDVFFVQGFEQVNMALRVWIERNPGKIHWIIWSHSVPGPMPEDHILSLDVPDSTFIAITPQLVEPLCERYGITPDRVRVVRNPVCPKKTTLSDPISQKIYNHFGLWQYDHVGVYPTRICSAKNIEAAVRLFSYLENSILIVAGVWANCKESEDLIEKFKQIETEIKCGSTFVYTPELCPCYATGLPFETIQSLLHYSDIFVMPSLSESSSLITIEAALAKNLCIINSDVPALQDLLGENRTLQASFGNLSKLGEADLKELANRIHAVSEQNPISVLHRHVRKNHDPNMIYLKELSKLLTEFSTILQ